MGEQEQALLVEMTNRYNGQQLPWNHELPPPEVLALVDVLPPGRMLDMGCGLGRACLYLAKHGWQCDGVDFVEQAIQTARQRAEAAGLADRITFHGSSVGAVDFLQPPYDLVIDVGCLHAQAADVCIAYANQVKRLLQPGGLFLLFAHVRDDAAGTQGRWLTSAQIDSLFQSGFVAERIERGTTTVGDNTWPSAWYWLRRTRE
ncbi:MAG: class I SAM-dependent methyltransferase [Caldilineaceae bacterium]